MRLVCFYWHPQNSMKRPSAQTAGCRTLHTQPISNYSQPQRLRPKATEQLICSVHFSGHNLQDQESCNLIGCSHFHSFTLWFSATHSRLKKKKNRPHNHLVLFIINILPISLGFPLTFPAAMMSSVTNTFSALPWPTNVRPYLLETARRLERSLGKSSGESKTRIFFIWRNWKSCWKEKYKHNRIH